MMCSMSRGRLVALVSIAAVLGLAIMTFGVIAVSHAIAARSSCTRWSPEGVRVELRGATSRSICADEYDSWTTSPPDGTTASVQTCQYRYSGSVITVWAPDPDPEMVGDLICSDIADSINMKAIGQ